MGWEGFGRERLTWRESLRKTTLLPDLKPLSAFYAPFEAVRYLLNSTTALALGRSTKMTEP